MLLLAQRAERPPAPACCVLPAVCGVGVAVSVYHASRISMRLCGSVDKHRGAFGWELAKSTAPKVFGDDFVFIVIWDVSAVINCQMEDGRWRMEDG